MQQLFPSTPLTGRRYLKSKEIQHNVTPVSTATQSVSRLQTLLAGRPASPSETLLELFRFVLCNIKNRADIYVYVKVALVHNHASYHEDIGEWR
jgi:retinoblastoma-like protein 1